jgi:hypothetical protein
MENIKLILESSVDALGLDATSKIVSQLLLDLVQDRNVTETECPVQEELAIYEPNPIAGEETLATNTALLARANRSAKQTTRKSKPATRKQPSIGKRLKYKKFPNAKSLFDCRDELRNGASLVGRFRDGEIDYVISGIEGATAYVPDGYVTSRGQKTAIDLKASHHFWKVVGELPEVEEKAEDEFILPMVWGHEYRPQRPLPATESNLRVGSLISRIPDGDLSFVTQFNSEEVEVMNKLQRTHWLPLMATARVWEVIGYSESFAKQVAARA